MLRVDNISKSYGNQILFDEASLQLQPRERLGLVGRNGHGKSTLFQMILGELEADSGEIILPSHYKIGHIEQLLNFTKPTLLEEGCLGLSEEEIHDHYKVERILFGLGFTNDDLTKPPGSFSGGFQVRLNLAKVLVSNPNLLLLDEPTNYLDIVSIRWIVNFLRGWKHELIIISHDREFMDSITTHTAAIHRHQIRKIKGGTDKLYAQIELDESVYEQTRQNEEKQRKHMEQFVERFRAKATKAKAAQSRMKMLEKLPKREALANIASLNFKFQHEPLYAKRLLEARDLKFGYDPAIPLFKSLNMTVSPKDRIAVIGKNGKGKSTFIKVLNGELISQTGSINTHPNLSIGYFAQTNIDQLHLKMTVEEEVASSNPALGRTATRSICGSMMFPGDDAEKKISILSGGERSRVMLGKIIAAPTNLLLLDEPTNHLDIQSIDSLVRALKKYEGAVILVTHSEMVLRSVANRLLVFQGTEASWFEGGYDEFLRKIGWQEEAGVQAKKATPSTSKKLLRQQRAAIITERTKTLKPLQEKIKKLEARIVDLENKIATANKDIEDASLAKDPIRIIELSKKIKMFTNEITTTFDRLEAADKKHEKLSAEFAENIC